jgi:hypothetical protein
MDSGNCSDVAKLQRQARFLFVAKIMTGKSLLAFGTSESILSGGCERPRSPWGCIGGIRGDDRDRTFLGERRVDSSPVCSAVTRPPEMAAFSFA